ncbi:MAG: 3-methyl-2-oxobutanoate hydroxymethyltransferase [Alphaproteobacteria bacterium]
MTRKKPTVSDLRVLKGRGQLTMLFVRTLDGAAAAEEAGIEIVSAPPDQVSHPDYRGVAPSLFTMTGMDHRSAGTRDDYLRFASKMLKSGADAIYSSGSVATIRFLADEHIPVVGHVGLVPSRHTFTGGFRAVGKTAAGAQAMLDEVRAYEAAGAFAVEIEVVPVEVAKAISQRVGILLWSMGPGAGCDAQYLFSEDILGENRGHMPRHAKVYRNFAAEHDRLQRERVAAYAEFIADVASGALPQDRHVVKMDAAELAVFLKELT